MPEDRVPLFVRLPQDQAAALDRLVGSTGRRKQQLVSQLLGEQLGVGRIDIREGAEAREDDVLTLEEAAALLRLPIDVLRARADAGELPGRRFGEEWRFSRKGVMDWLAAGEGSPGDGGAAGSGGARG
jgi:excisionase family DNA binding protein